MKMAKASEKDIDAAGAAMSVLQDISSGYYPKRDGDECDDFRFDPEDPVHLRKFYDLMNATLDASPGWPGRVIGGMCYVILYSANRIVDPDADTLELHPSLTRGVKACLSPDGMSNHCVLWKCHEAKACARGGEASPVPLGFNDGWQFFVAYMIDHCERETVSEEMLQRTAAAFLRDPKYARGGKEQQCR